MHARRRRLGRSGDFQCSSASRKFLNGLRGGTGIAGSATFSALQRAENSSMPTRARRGTPSRSFSALQRAENSSIERQRENGVFDAVFQCSSASRKFLNRAGCGAFGEESNPFSALQRAENSSIPTLAPASIHISDRDDHASSFLSLPGASP